MKTIYILITSMVLMFSLNSNAQIVKAEIRATGLTCSMCSNAINKQLKTVPEVVNVELQYLYSNAKRRKRIKP